MLAFVVIAGLLTQREAKVFLFALGMLGLGLLFWFANQAVGKREVRLDPARLEG